MIQWCDILIAYVFHLLEVFRVQLFINKINIRFRTHQIVLIATWFSQPTYTSLWFSPWDPCPPGSLCSSWLQMFLFSLLIGKQRRMWTVLKEKQMALRFCFKPFNCWSTCFFWIVRYWDYTCAFRIAQAPHQRQAADCTSVSRVLITGKGEDFQAG